ncbi:hypothetical protein KEM52_000485 [Ascosphaera acerosa]|nr:hypothetical protein KEM52_000485 [Ascosphaera acerosa]
MPMHLSMDTGRQLQVPRDVTSDRPSSPIQADELASARASIDTHLLRAGQSPHSLYFAEGGGPDHRGSGSSSTIGYGASRDIYLRPIASSETVCNRFSYSETDALYDYHDYWDEQATDQGPTGPLEDGLSGRSLLIISVATFSFLGSLTFFSLAVVRPDWSPVATKDTSEEVIPIILTVLAKLVEMAFVTTYVVSLDQHFSHSSFGKGTTFAEINLRNWILQPGMIITPSAGIKESALTMVGSSTIIATIGAVFFTTATQFLIITNAVGWSDRLEVSAYHQTTTRFANFSDMLTRTESDRFGRSMFELKVLTKTAIDFPSWYINWQHWDETSDARPAPTSSWTNTSLPGRWRQYRRHVQLSRPRLIDNATLTYAHVDAIDTANSVLRELSSRRETDVQFFAPNAYTPMINTLCAAASADEVAPLLALDESVISDLNQTQLDRYRQWRTRNLTRDESDTADLARIFDWTYPRNAPPAFPEIAQPGATVISTDDMRSASYVLYGLPAGAEAALVCRIQAGLIRGCGTQVTIGSRDVAEPLEALGYTSEEQKWSPYSAIFKGWPPDDAKYLNGTQSKPDGGPSLAEIFSALCGTVALYATAGSPLVSHGYDDLQPPYFDKVDLQYYKTELLATVDPQGPSLALWGPLGIVFVYSTICLAYLVSRLGGRYMRDVTDPHNMFWLGLNTQPQKGLPEGYRECGQAALHQRWRIEMDEATCCHYVAPLPTEPRKRRSTLSDASSVDEKSRLQLDLEQAQQDRQVAMEHYHDAVHRAKRGFIATHRP